MNKSNNINLLITDMHMPAITGLELISKLRLTFNDYELPILAFSGSTNDSIVPKLLKNGANDFIHKPLHDEEFLTRFNTTLDRSRTIKENKELIKALEVSSMTDYLTNLYNRKYFYKTTPHLYSQSKRENKTFGLLMLDIDFFKKINDTYGHETGDKVLIEVSKTIKNSARASDFIFRWRGEEFLVLSPNTKKEDLLHFANKVRKNIESLVIKQNKKTQTNINITISIGACLCLNEDIDENIKIADEALYEAKESGRNKVIFLED